MKSSVDAASTIAILSILILASPARATHYAINPIEAPGAESRAYAINNDGQIAGVAYPRDPHGVQRGFRWSGAKFEFSGSTASHACALNGKGAIVGWTIDGTGHQQALRSGAPMSLLAPDRHSCEARAINDLGQIAGTFVNPAGDERAFVRAPDGTMSTLETLGGSIGRAWGMNSFGAVVGEAFLEGDQVCHAFVYDPGTKLTDLGTLPGGRNSVAYAINDEGVVVGAAENAAGLAYPVRWTAGRIETLGSWPGRALAVNGAGDAVGGWADLRAFAFVGGTMLDLRTVLATPEGWDLWEARGINDAGAIVGWGFFRGAMRGFVLQPGEAGVVAAGSEGGTLRFQARPSVSAGAVTFALGLRSPGAGRITLYSVSGRRIRGLDVLPGEAKRVWDGRDEFGVPVPSGLVLARLEGALGPAVTRLFIVR